MFTGLVGRCTLGLLLTTATYTQEQAVCPLPTAKNGDMVILTGEAVHGAHDGLVRLAGCTDEVLLDYVDDPNISRPKPTLRRDEMFRRFTEYFNAEQAAPPNAICKGCWKYRVTAVFEGRLDVTESAGLKKDAKTGKVTGIVGFGHPMPFTRYRLVLLLSRKWKPWESSHEDASSRGDTGKYILLNRAARVSDRFHFANTYDALFTSET